MIAKRCLRFDPGKEIVIFYWNIKIMKPFTNGMCFGTIVAFRIIKDYSIDASFRFSEMLPSVGSARYLPRVPIGNMAQTAGLTSGTIHTFPVF